VAGSNYSVNITLDTSKVEGKLKTLEKRIADFRKNLAKPLKISAQTQKLEEKKLKMQDAQRASMIQTRKIGDIIQKQEEQGLKVDKARSHLRKAAVLDNKKLFKAAETQRKLAMEELKIEQNELKVKQKQTQELLRQNELERQLSASQGITAKGAFSRLSDRQSRDVEGRRTFMNNPLTGFMSKKFGATRGFDFGSALISGGFPLLFGQGPLGALAGGLGGGIGGMFGQMGGFAGGIAATAALQTLTNVINGVKAFGEGLQDVDGALATVTEKSLFSSEATEKRAEALKKLGKQEELAKLLTRELTLTLGKDGLARVQALGKSSKELARNFGQLGASLQAVLAKAILPAINALNKILSGFTVPQQFTNFKASLSGSDLARFNEIVTEQRGSKNKNVRGGKTKMVQGMLTKSVMQNSLKLAMDEGLGGGPSAFTTSTDPTIAANLQERIDFLNRSLEVGREKAELERKIAEFRKRGTELSDEDLEKQLNQINQLEKVEALYQEIGSTIESGIVDAIESAINGTKTLGDVARSVFAQIQRSLIKFSVDNLLSELKIPGRAEGGPVKKGGSFIVGERGPELFVPGRSGTIVPNNQLGSSTNVVVNVDASGSNVEGDEQGGRELGRLISAAVQSEIVQQQRPGGLLA